MEKVFIYGTLINSEIRQQICGRTIPIEKTAKIAGYTLKTLTDEGIDYPVLVPNCKAMFPVFGLIIHVKPTELDLLDAYEGNLYKRTELYIDNETKCWVYLGIESV